MGELCGYKSGSVPSRINLFPGISRRPMPSVPLGSYSLKNGIPTWRERKYKTIFDFNYN